MSKQKIYLAGGISGLSYSEANEWRTTVQKELRDNFTFFNPLDYIAVEFEAANEPQIVMPKEADEAWMRTFDLNMLRRSDVMLVCFNAPNSLGTAQELALANEWGIPIIGVYDGDTAKIHPWLRSCCDAIVPTIYDAMVWLNEFFGMTDY